MFIPYFHSISRHTHSQHSATSLIFVKYLLPTLLFEEKKVNSCCVPVRRGEEDSEFDNNMKFLCIQIEGWFKCEKLMDIKSV